MRAALRIGLAGLDNEPRLDGLGHPRQRNPGHRTGTLPTLRAGIAVVTQGLPGKCPDPAPAPAGCADSPEATTKAAVKSPPLSAHLPGAP